MCYRLATDPLASQRLAAVAGCTLPRHFQVCLEAADFLLWPQLERYGNVKHIRLGGSWYCVRYAFSKSPDSVLIVQLVLVGGQLLRLPCRGGLSGIVASPPPSSMPTLKFGSYANGMHALPAGEESIGHKPAPGHATSMLQSKQALGALERDDQALPAYRDIDHDTE